MSILWKPQGDLTLDSINVQQKALKKFLLSQKQEGVHPPQNIIIDLSHVKRSDSAGLAFMIEAVRLVRTEQCTIYFQSIPEQMMTMMQFCNIWSFFKEEKWIN